ncbi:hypothetical protein UY3_01569 [Chelonia mydas]|uniref:Uncharacterized protein n=1 Tax=Chelonia mydas TaxID=8469 RepID=M7BTI3_CHEMY|nr:hypothetical protein UY3_01569 [Chelonia mydas]
MKIKELRQVYQKVRDAKSHSGAALQICHLYNELHAILSSNPTTTPNSSLNTSEELESQARADNTQEEVLDKQEEEEENGRQAGEEFILPDGQELFVTSEQSNQSENSIVAECDAGKGTSGCPPNAADDLVPMP